MLLKQIKISNFKSISNLKFEVKKHGTSYTSMFVGINEVGKSNILKAMSFLETPEEEINFLDLNNQNNDKEDFVVIYFEFEFENDKTYLNALKKNLVEPNTFLKVLNIQTITKNVYLRRGTSSFEDLYVINWEYFKLEDYFYFDYSTGKYKIEHKDKLRPDESAVFKKLDKNKLHEILLELLEETIKKYETKVSFWKPEKNT